jgi:putative hydrolase of the HAD superfamily
VQSDPLKQTKLRRVLAITLDVGGTLIECCPSVGHLYAQVAARHGHPNLSPTVLNKNFKAAWSRLRGFQHTVSDWASLVDTTFGSLVTPPPSQTFFPRLFDRFSEPDAWRIFEDVVPTLTALRQHGFRLGIISNWDERLRPLLKRLRLDTYFQTIIVSCEMGAQKPDSRLFEAACASLGTAPAETLHVGDSLEMDVQGARSAGLGAAWLQRGARRSSPGQILSLEALNKL